MTLTVSKINPKEATSRPIDYIDISGIDNTRNVIRRAKRYRLEDAPSRARQIVCAGDVIFATVRPYLRNIAAVPNVYDQPIASTGFSVLRPAKGVCPAFLFYKAISRDFVNALSKLQYGVSYPAVKDEQVRDQPLWLPPTHEQYRIVAKLEELFSELDKGVEHLEKAREQLKVYRQAVLKHAFEGKLTAQWREGNKDQLENPAQLLACITKEREAHYERQLTAWKVARTKWKSGGKQGNAPVKPRPANDAAPIGNADRGRLVDLPDGWAWIRLAQLFAISPKNGVYKPASEYGSGTQIIRIDDFYDGRLIRVSGLKRLRLSNAEIAKYQVSNSDLIINRVNSIEHLGKCALVDGLTENTVIESNIMKIHVIQDIVSRKYIAAYLASHEGRKRLCENAKHAVNQASINQSDVGNALIPIPSIEEQLLIVEKIEGNLSKADALISDTRDHLKKSKALRQSILKKAFSGQLVAQDPNDEPASVLLERIKAEKVAQSRSAKLRNKRQRAKATA